MKMTEGKFKCLQRLSNSKGVIAAAALRCLGGEIQGRLKFRNDDEKQRAKKMGITDLEKKYALGDLCKSDEAMFAATGVTDGTILRGVQFMSHGAKTHSIVMRAKTKTIRFVEARHSFEHFPDY